MEKANNYGIYSELIQQYADYKRSKGYKMVDIERRLHRFDMLTIERNETEIGISRDLFNAWKNLNPLESERNRETRMLYLRGFSSYLRLLGYDSYVPKLRKTKHSFIPHIYTKREMAAIFKECDKMGSTQCVYNSIRGVIPLIIRMLYGTGIRIGEALKLCHKDVNLALGTLTLHECKNGQDRIVPMSLSLTAICKDYVVYKEHCNMSVEPDAPFFSSADGKRCRGTSINRLFKAVLQRAGIFAGAKGKTPRLHDLRHTFCVESLVKMSESGKDLYNSLPLLMTYVGHKSLYSTNQYVRMTQQMYPQLIAKVDDTYRCVFPDINIETEE